MSRNRDGAATRKERIDYLVDLIARHHEEPYWDEARFIGNLMRKTGLTRKKAVEYLEDVEYMGYIERCDGKIKYLLDDKR